LALLYQARQDFKTADQYYQRAILIGEKGLGGEHFEITDTLEQYATFLRNTGKTAEANKVAARIRELRDHPRKEP
ncbi:MAG TPA: tetratricopeptide repeat protein, partial [Bryobacteraceae bacterium]|nr:tetratricopeptide repeat protein [Bryobacteraceae bacterium]